VIGQRQKPTAASAFARSAKFSEFALVPTSDGSGETGHIVGSENNVRFRKE
jgi:hypothetical protein